MICREPNEIEVSTIAYLMNFQFGVDIRNTLKDLVSRKQLRICLGSTGRIRKILVNNTLFATIRASDYHVVPHEPLARILHEKLPFPRLRIAVFNDMLNDLVGKNTIFCRHVALCDEGLGPGDEVLIVSEDDDLLGVATLRIDCETIITAIRGAAANVRFWCIDLGGLQTPSGEKT